MHSTLFIAILSLSSVVAHSDWCGSVDPPPEVVDVSRTMQAATHAKKRHLPHNYYSKRIETMLITTYVHIIETEELAGYVTDKMLHDQVYSPRYTSSGQRAPH